MVRRSTSGPCGLQKSHSRTSSRRVWQHGNAHYADTAHARAAAADIVRAIPLLHVSRGCFLRSAAAGRADDCPLTIKRVSSQSRICRASCLEHLGLGVYVEPVLGRKSTKLNWCDPVKRRCEMAVVTVLPLRESVTCLRMNTSSRAGLIEDQEADVIEQLHKLLKRKVWSQTRCRTHAYPSDCRFC